MQIVFLYTEIADYFVNACKHYAKVYPKDDIHIIKFDVNKEAPFEFPDLPKQITFYNRLDYSDIELLALVDKIKPSAIIASGWVDKAYMKIAKKYKKSINTALIIDNHWHGNLKQKVLRVLSPLVLKNKFSHTWVPGIMQKEYSIKLGFKEENVIQGFYCANPTLYNQFYQDYKEDKEKAIPKRIIVVARYIPQKNLERLWRAFASLTEQEADGWELWCIGSGQDYDQRTKHDRIKHFGFVQPKDMGKYIKVTGVFILPSIFEPWGVAVHEFAIAGYPLLLSNAIGAGSAFLKAGINGFEFNPNSETNMKDSILKVIQKPNEELVQMGLKSREFSNTINVDDWVKNLNNLCK